MNKEIEIIRYLLDEVEEEVDYKKKHDEAMKEASSKAREYEKNNPRSEEDSPFKYYKSSFDFLPENFYREPNKSLVKSRMKMVRELALKCYNK